MNGHLPSPSTVLPPGILPSLNELIALRPRRVAGNQPSPRIETRLPGQHATARHGPGMAFAEVRPYYPGDDVRTVDWRQSARRGRLYTKLYEEERERALYLLVDLGPEMRFGTRSAFKSVVAARAAAWLAWRAIAAGDRIGGVIWNGDKALAHPPRRHDHGALTFLRALVDTATVPAPVDASPLATPLNRLAAHPTHGAQIILISDFARLDGDAEARIRHLAHGAELTLLQICDPFEMAAPPPARYPVTDGTLYGQLDLQSAAGRARHVAEFAAHCDRLATLAHASGCAHLQLATDAPLPRKLSSAFLSARSPAA